MIASLWRLKYHLHYSKYKIKKIIKQIEQIEQIFYFYKKSVSVINYKNGANYFFKIDEYTKRLTLKLEEERKRSEKLKKELDKIIDKISLFNPIKIWTRTNEIKKKLGFKRKNFSSRKTWKSWKVKYKKNFSEKRKTSTKKGVYILENYKLFYFKNIEKFSSILLNGIIILNYLTQNNCLVNDIEIEISFLPTVNNDKIHFISLNKYNADGKEEVGIIWFNFDNMQWELSCDHEKEKFDELIIFLNESVKDKEVVIIPRNINVINVEYINNDFDELKKICFNDEEFFYFNNIKEIPDNIWSYDVDKGFMNFIEFYYNNSSLEDFFNKKEKRKLEKEKKQMMKRRGWK